MALRWRGSWTAAPGGGAATVPSVRFTLSLSSLLLASVLSSACFLSLRSPLSPSVSSKKIHPILSPSVSPFIEKKNVAGKLLLVRLQSRLAGRFFRWWWGRGEREAGQFFKNFLFFCYRLEGGKEEEEQCRSKWHRSVFPLFFFLT